jgi:hypothetical protein
MIGHGLKCGLGHGCREPFTKEIEEMKIGLGSIMGGFTNDDMDRTWHCHHANSQLDMDWNVVWDMDVESHSQKR